MIYNNNEYCINYEEWENIIKGLKLWDRLVSAKSIVIKPNFAAGTYVDPKTHVITDMELLRSSIEFFLSVNKDAVIYIAESDSTGYGFAYLKFEHLELPQSLGLSSDSLNRVALLDMSRDRLKRIESQDFLRFNSVDRQLWISKIFMEADFKVDFSNLKTHSVTGYTGACKNLFGCLPDLEKYHNHPYIHQVIHDLVLAIEPDLCVVDAFYGMELNGPVNGLDINSGYRVFSNDALEADVYAATTIGFNPNKVKYLKLLAKTKKVELNTEAELIKVYKKPTKFLSIMNDVGLVIQRMGLSIEEFGHRVHGSTTPLVLFITITRPILLKLFDYEKLKAWKRKIVK